MSDAGGKQSQNPILGWTLLAVLLVWIGGIYLAADAGYNVVAFAGLAALGVAFWYFSRRGRKYYEAHPSEAAEAKKLRTEMVARSTANQRRHFKTELFGTIIWSAVAIGLVVAVKVYGKSVPTFIALSRENQEAALIVIGAMIFVALNLVWMAWKRRPRH